MFELLFYLFWLLKQDFKTKYKKDQKLKCSFKVLKFMSRRVVRDQTYIQANVDVIRYNL